MYKLIFNSKYQEVQSVSKVDGNLIFIMPFDPANTDYQTFKKDLADGAQLQDADGNVIDGIAYLEELA
jgi:hypothetical protein